jgi:hypothetical protein
LTSARDDGIVVVRHETRENLFEEVRMNQMA